MDPIWAVQFPDSNHQHLVGDDKRRSMTLTSVVSTVEFTTCQVVNDHPAGVAKVKFGDPNCIFYIYMHIEKIYV